MFTAHHAVLTLCLGIGLAGPALANDPADVLVTRSYDLLALGPALGDEAREFMLLPYTTDHDSESETLDLAEIVSSLLYDVVATDEMQFEGRDILALEDGRLLVVAPSAVHADIERLLSTLAAGFGRALRVELSVEALSATGPDRAEALSLLSADQLRQQWVRGEPVWSAELSLPLGQARRFRSEVVHEVVREWGLEIAQTSVHAEPVSESLRTGLDMLLMAQSLGGDRFLVRQLGRVGELSGRESRNVPLIADVITEVGRDRVFTNGKVDDLTVSWASLAASAVMTPGEAAQQILWARTEAGLTGWLVTLRVLGVDGQASARFGANHVRVIEATAAFTGGPGQVADGESDAARRIVWPSRHEVNDVRWSNDDVHLHRTLLGAARDTSPVDVVLSGLYERGGNAWVRGRWVVAAGPSDALDALARDLGALAGTPPSLRLEVGVDGAADGELGLAGPLARTTLGLVAGESVFGLVGDARSYVTIRGVDVANGASGTEGGMGDLFDGLMVMAEAHRDGARVSVDLGRLLEIESYSPEGALRGSNLDRTTVLSGSVEADLRANGERQLLGRFGAPGGGKQLVIWARLSQP